MVALPFSITSLSRRCAGAVALLGALSSGVFSFAACTDEGSGACATQVTPEVCETPANLRGVEPVQQSRVTATAPELVAEPLIDGRYAQTALTLYCAEDFQPLVEGRSVQALAELSGCVMRITLVAPDLEQPQVSVLTFRYAAGGTLDWTPACSSEPAPVLGRRYGFDGTTLQLANDWEETDTNGQIQRCERIDTFELR
jgi:hypothetical protein